MAKINQEPAKWINPPTTEQLIPFVQALARAAARRDFKRAIAEARSGGANSENN